MLIIDDIDLHMPLAGSIERAACPPGFFLAWCANLQMLSDDFSRRHADALVRLRMRDLTPGEFLITCGDGRFGTEELNARGRAFADSYYQVQYLNDFAATFDKNGPDDEHIYDVEDNWANYDKLAGVLTRRLYGSQSSPQASTGRKPRNRAASWLRVITGGRKD